MYLANFLCRIGLHRWGKWEKKEGECRKVSRCQNPKCHKIRTKRMHFFEYSSIDMSFYRGHKAICTYCGYEKVESHKWKYAGPSEPFGEDIIFRPPGVAKYVCSLCGEKF